MEISRMRHISQKSNFALLLASLGALWSCKPSSFQSIDSKREVTKTSESFSCGDEKSKTISLKNAKANVLQLSKSCSLDASSTKTPADIVFVIDVTGSMEDSLNAVKNGVEQFAIRLRQDKGWDARFAAIGYRDAVTAQVPFTDEKNLALQLRNWEADGGNDPQEAGQAGLAAALEILTRDLTNKPERATASKNILFIGDAITYSLNNDHFDFSTGQLERLFDAAPAQLKSQLKFYYSAAREVDQCLSASLFGCARMGKSTKFAAQPQISAFAQKIGLQGKGFEFPFTESILLNEFVDEFTPGQSCALKAALVKDTAGRELGRIGENGSFDIPRGLTSNSLNIEVERCCAAPASPSAKPGTASPGANACKPVKSNFSVRLK